MLRAIKVHHHKSAMSSLLVSRTSSHNLTFTDAEHHTHCGTVARNEERRTIATETPLTGYEPNLFDFPEDYEGVDASFRDTNLTQLINHDSDGQYPDPTAVDDEHFKSEFASPLPTQERGARTDLTQTHHSNEESLLRSAPLISARTGEPSPM